MALSYRCFIRNCYQFTLTKPVQSSLGKNVSVRLIGNCRYEINPLKKQLLDFKHISLVSIGQKRYTTQNEPMKPPESEEPRKIGLVQRFKQMYRDYWYVLVPVHMLTSAFWFGSSYYAVRSGVDVLSILETLGVSERVIEPLRDSSAGYFALAFALYKIVTPLRYAVTVGGTTFAIKRLTAIGWIKPVPSRERIKEMLQEKKDNLQGRFNESKQHYQSQMQEKRNHVMDEMRRYKSDIRNLKNKVKKM